MLRTIVAGAIAGPHAAYGIVAAATLELIDS